MNFDYDKHLVYKVMSGSRAYGTETPQSDTDWKGIIIPPLSFLLGTQGFEQHQGEIKEENTEYTYFGLKKFCALASKCNPNVIEMLYVRDEDILVDSPWAQELRDRKDIFLSKSAVYSFSGYAMSQLKRIKTHRNWLLNPPSHKPTRAEYNLPEHTAIPKDQLGAANSLIRRYLHNLVPALEKMSNAEREEFWGGLDELVVIYAESRGLTLSEAPARLIDRLQAAGSAIFGKTEAVSIGHWTNAVDKVEMHTGTQLGFTSDFMTHLANEKSYSHAKRNWDQYNHWVKTRNPARADLEARYGYDCYSDDTEFLTNDGWKTYDSISGNCKLATVDPLSGEMHFVQPEESFDKKYSGDMYHIHARHTDCLVTENHKMLVSSAHRSSSNGFSTKYTEEKADWDLIPVIDLVKNYRSSYHLRTSVSPLKDDYPISNEELILMGCYVSEGCIDKVSSSGDVRSIRFEQKVDGSLNKYANSISNVIRSDINKGEYSGYLYRYSSNPDLAQKIVAECGSGSYNKKLPPWVLNLSKDQVNLVLDVLIAGDGTKRKHSDVYYTVSKELADNIQAMCVSAGITSQIWGPYKNVGFDGKEFEIYQVYLNREQVFPRAVFNKTGFSQNIKKIKVVNKRVVCFTVAPYHTLVTRRNGKVAIHGNCKHAMHLVRLMRMGKQLVTEGTMDVYRPDREELQQIRNGAWEYDQLIEWSEAADKEIHEVAKSGQSKLPKKADQKAIDEILVRFNLDYNLEERSK